MDGKYAKYIQNFMKSFKINDQKVEIQTESNVKNRPLSYELNSRIIEKCNDKLDMQYQIIVDKKDEIKKDLTKSNKILTAILGIIFVLTFGLYILIPATIGTSLLLGLKIATIASAALTVISATTLVIKNINFENIINIINGYKKNRKNIEITMDYDENITKYLSDDTKIVLSEKKIQVEKGNATEILDIDFMDKLFDKKIKGRRELINLLNMYKAVICLRQEPTYIAPFEEKESLPKKKSRKKEETE